MAERRPYTVDAAAEHLGCSPGIVRELCRNGELPFFRFGRIVRIPAAAIAEWPIKPFDKAAILANRLKRRERKLAELSDGLLSRKAVEALDGIGTGPSLLTAPQPTPPVPIVYFVASNSLVKIGWTGDWVEKRLAGLRTMSAVPVELIGTIPGELQNEREMHARFAEERQHGEWFSPSLRLLCFLAETFADV